MEQALMIGWGNFGAVAALAFSAMGSALGSGAAGPAAVGAWKKCYIQNRAAPFLLVVFVGAPLSQTIYGMILMNALLAAARANPLMWPALIGSGVFGGIAIGLSAWYQGVAGAAASDSLAETGKGLGNYLMALGIIETVALFVMVFILTAVR